jgi:hypothetical protein
MDCASARERICDCTRASNCDIDEHNVVDCIIDQFLADRARRAAITSRSKISDGDSGPYAAQRLGRLGVRVQASGATALIVFPSISTPSNSSTPSTASSSRSTRTPFRVHVPSNLSRRHRDTPERQKIAYSLDALEIEAALAFRLNFSPKREKKLRTDAAAGKDILQAISTEIARQFTRRGYPAPALVFALEESKHERRLHIHGVLLLAQEIDRKLLREILTAAGGGAAFTGHAAGNGTWIKDGPVEDARAYIRYARKDEFRMMGRLGLDRVVYMNDRARRLGRQLYEARREAMLAKAATTPTSACPVGPTSAQVAIAAALVILLAIVARLGIVEHLPAVLEPADAGRHPRPSLARWSHKFLRMLLPFWTAPPNNAIAMR